MITGITPQEALARRGLWRPRLPAASTICCSRCRKPVSSAITTCAIDDEVTRNIFYRNFYDPYAWSWQHDNSRWDLLDVMRACYALRPEGIAWPENDEGLPSFRLEHLTVANGIEHQNAHDAMADVYATIAMAKLVKTRQPRLFDYLYSHRNKRKLATLIDVPQMKPLVHVSGMFGAARVQHRPGGAPGLASGKPQCGDYGRSGGRYGAAAGTGCRCPARAALHPARRGNLAICRRRRCKLVHLNKCPVLAQANTLRPQDADRLGISVQRCLERRPAAAGESAGAREGSGGLCRSRTLRAVRETSTPSCTMGSLAMPTARR
ncbi:exodeoxyribonuclease I [Klebsiella pneumoniae]|nr:exodeoxyribonuclease I [Klebsiella pneumoniae]